MRRATMRDVADRAGVSLKTVSRVVNVEPGVSADLTEKVQRAAQQLDYRHNLAARNLRRSAQRSAMVAVLVQDLSNAYSAALLRAVDDVARQHQVLVVSTSLDEEEDREREVVANLIGRRVDGLILMPATQDQSYLAAEISAGFAIVMIDRPPAGLCVDSVLVDNLDGAREATEHLLGGGHRRVAIITDDHRIQTARQRLDGYRLALRAAGIVPDPDLELTTRTAAGAVVAAESLLALPDPPTAIFAARNVVTEGVVTALRRAAMSAEVALVGFDDVPLADVLEPGITVVEQQASEVGRRAAELLLARLQGGADPPQRVLLPTRLIIRGSGEIRPPDAGRSVPAN